MTMVFIETDEEGPGSFDELVGYVKAVLEENFVPVLEKNVGTHDPYERRARNIVMSILNRLDIERPT
jgi:hypothetical protein